MLRKIAVLFGIIFVVIGVLGFVPGVTTNGMLLGLFHVNLLHNVVHLLSGAVALYAGNYSEDASRKFFQIFGVVYGIVAVLGFYYGPQDILGVLANNNYDTGLHVVIALASLYLGFLYKEIE